MVDKKVKEQIKVMLNERVDNILLLQKEKFMIIINDRMKENKGNREVLRELLYIKALLEEL